MTIICLWLIVYSQGVVWRKSMLRVHWLSDPSFDGQFPNQISMYANVCYNRVEPRRHLSCLSSPSHITPTLLPVFVVAGLSCLPHTALSVAHVLNHIFGWMLPPFVWKLQWFGKPSEKYIWTLKHKLPEYLVKIISWPTDNQVVPSSQKINKLARPSPFTRT